MNTPIHIALLTFVVFAGFFLRIVNLSSNPPGFFADEAVIGLDAYSLLHSKKDHSGNRPGFFFQGLGFPLGFVPIISAVPTVALFGLNEFATRLPQALYGVGSIVLVYGITHLFYEEYTALIATTLLALSPWHIHVSRMGMEVSSFLFWLLLSIWLFLRGTTKSKLLFPAFISFGIAIYTYTPARVIVPIFIIVLALIFQKRVVPSKWQAIVWGSFIAFFFLSLPLLASFLNKSGMTRFSAVSVANVGISSLDTLFHVFKSYINYFSFSFLFTKGDIDFPGQFITRHSIRGIGLLYLFQLPFLLFGVGKTLGQWHTSSNKLLLTWLFLYPVAGSLTVNVNPYATRGIIGVVPFQILTSIGLVAMAVWVKNRLKRLFTPLVVSVGLVFLLSFLVFIQKWQQYPLYASDFWGWQFGPRDIMQYFLAHKDSYDELFLVGNFNSPEIFLRFYDPENHCRSKCTIGDISRLNYQKKQLFAIGVDRLAEFPTQQFTSQQIIYYPNGSPAFYLGTFTSPAI